MSDEKPRWTPGSLAELIQRTAYNFDPTLTEANDMADAVERLCRAARTVVDADAPTSGRESTWQDIQALEQALEAAEKWQAKR